jgi:hypothetical protein
MNKPGTPTIVPRSFSSIQKPEESEKAPSTDRIMQFDTVVDFHRIARYSPTIQLHRSQRPLKFSIPRTSEKTKLDPNIGFHHNPRCADS